MKRLLTILCLLIPFLGVKAGTLKGKIIDQDAQPVAGAVITYYSCSDNSILASTTSDVNGNWELSYEDAWINIHIVARAEGYTSYTLHGFNVSMNHTWPKIIFHLFNAIDYKAGKRSTIYLPEAPDASWGRFYRLDHEDGNKVVFEREYTPKAYVPYVFFPYQDLHIDISKMDLFDHHDQVRLEHISFSSAINYSEGLPDPEESLIMRSLDETLPYAKYSEEGAIVDYLSPAPMHAILSWMWYDFFEGNEEDGTWKAVSPEFIFHDPEPTTYHPFVEAGKKWRVHGFSMGSDHTLTDYGFSDAQEYISHDGHEYFKFIAWRDNQLTEVGEVREEDRRVYFYDTDASQEYMIYDFSLKAGDIFQETRHNLTFTVDSIGQMIVNGDTLKTLHLSALDGVVTAYWVEGVGNTNSPLENFYAETPVSWSYRVAYVSGSSYWPFTFGVNWNGWWGTQLKTFGQAKYSQQTDSLTYELVKDPDRDVYNLHVYGWQRVTCGPNHYINCIAEPTEDLMVKKLKFQIEDVEPMADCTGTYYVDCSFPYFEKESTYIVTDARGDHVVSVSGLAPYRPFIEEGKVWKVGWFPGAMNRAKKLDYYYFEGDTIIHNRSCKKMLCRHEAAEGWGSTEPWTEYVGALYEEDRRVYCAFPNSETFELLYDFYSSIGTTLTIHGGSCIVAGRGVSWKSDFKGNYTSIALYQPIQEITGMWGNGYDFDHPNYWYEGLGRGRDPLDNSAEWGLAGNYYILINCTVGDEVISQYPNPHFVDDVTPSSADVKKQWIDFTHIKKPRPKAPARERTANETDEENLTGEYSVKQLFVNLKILSGTYAVTLKDAADNVVYRKQVQTSSTIALTTDLTKYPAGTYTLDVENSEEQYTATLTLPLDDTAVRDIPSIVNCKLSNCKWYDLSGRQLSTPPAKGIYIRDGKKVVR